MKTFLLVLLAFSLRAQQVVDDPARVTLGKTGQIFKVKIVPATKRLEISLVETPAVVLDPERLTIFGRVIPRNGPARSISIQAADGHFSLPESLSGHASLELKVQDTVTKKNETLTISPAEKGVEK